MTLRCHRPAWAQVGCFRLAVDDAAIREHPSYGAIQQPRNISLYRGSCFDWLDGRWAPCAGHGESESKALRVRLSASLWVWAAARAP